MVTILRIKYKKNRNLTNIEIKKQITETGNTEK